MFRVKQAVVVSVCWLVANSSPTWSDALFPNVNPYSCIYEAKQSAAPDSQRRQVLATCMTQVRDPMDAVRALESSGFDVSHAERRRIELAGMSGRYDEARDLLRRMIIGGW